MRYLGRKAELTQILRSIPALPEEWRARLGKSGNEARRALEALLEERSVALAAGELEHRLRAEAIDVTLPGEPLDAGHLHLLTTTRRELEDIFVGLGYRVVEGPEVELDYYNFTALNHPPGHPARMLQDTFYFSDEVLLRTHTSPMQVRAMEQQEPPDLHRRARQGLPARLGRDAHADVPPARGPRRRRGHHARRPPGHAAAVRARVLRRRPARAPAAALLPVHRAERRVRRVVLLVRRLRTAARRLARPAVQGHGLDRGRGRRHGRPERLRVRARSTATTPSTCRASRSASASTASRC